jgi:Fe-S-cluster-containing dehydrogenase component
MLFFLPAEGVRIILCEQLSHRALKREEGIIRRSNIICVSCKTCFSCLSVWHILQELLPYLVSRCDICIGRLKDGEEPLCVRSCKNGALSYLGEEAIKDQKNIYTIGDRVVVKIFNWLNTYGIKK